MMAEKTQRDRAKDMLRDGHIIRMNEFQAAGITAATIARMRDDGEVFHLRRGLYQSPDAILDARHSLAEVAKRAPKGVVCLTSALIFHEITDGMPWSIWLAVGKNDYSPKRDGPKLRVVRFTDRLLTEDVETKVIEGVPVKVFGVAKTIADCFRHRRSVGDIVALEGLQEALRQRKATPGEIAKAAISGGVFTIMRPYIEVLTANGY